MTVPRSLLILAAVALTASTCSVASSATPSAAPSASTRPATSEPTRATSGDTISGKFEVDGAKVFLECRGTGSPTVVFEHGLGGNSSLFAGVLADLAPTTRTCRYDRAGLGLSQPIPGVAELSVTQRADQLHALLGAAGIDGPYILAGFSYGGMVIRAFASTFAEETVGLVFLDGSHEDQFIPGGWWLAHQPVWADGVHKVDLATSRTQLLEATDLGDRPVVVLTSGRISGEIERQWTPLQDAIAAMSSNSLHMVAIDSGHDITADRPELVIDSVLAVVDSVRSDSALPACGPRFEEHGAECLTTTMGDLLAQWDAARAAVIPAPGTLPTGTYSFTEDGSTIEIDVAGGHLDLVLRHADRSTEALTADYVASGDEIVVRWPFDFRIPRTPGVNRATWSVDPDGTLHFVQVDDEVHESWLAAPWAPVTGAPS